MKQFLLFITITILSPLLVRSQSTDKPTLFMAKVHGAKPGQEKEKGIVYSLTDSSITLFQGQQDIKKTDLQNVNAGLFNIPFSDISKISIHKRGSGVPGACLGILAAVPLTMLTAYAIGGGFHEDQYDDPKASAVAFYGIIIGIPLGAVVGSEIATIPKEIVTTNGAVRPEQDKINALQKYTFMK